MAACGGDDKDSSSTTAAPASSNQTTQATNTSDSTASSTGGTSTDSSTATSATGGSSSAVEDCKETKAGSVLNYAVYTQSASLDPLQTSGALTGGTELISIYDVLMRWDSETGEWQPHAAESLTPNADFTQWTLKLRPEVKYANGEPMVAQHVIDNLNRMMGQGRNASRGLIERVDLANTKVVDEHTIEFKLFKPWSAFGYLLGDAPGMIPNPTLAAAKDDKGGSIIGNDPKGAGAGAYSVERYAPGESPYLVLKARPDYWGGAPCIETINFVNIPLDTAKAEAMETGEIDAAFMRTASVIEDMRAKDYGELLELQSAGIALLINGGVGTHNPITTDVRFRQAVDLALDPAIIKARGFDGVMREQRGLIHPDSAFYDPSAEAPPADTAKAKALVDELKAGGWDGKIRLVCAGTVPEQPIIIKTLLDSVGMDVENNVTDVNGQISAVAVDRNYDLACWGLNISDSAIWRQVGFNFYSSSTSNRVAFKDPAMDAAIDELFAAPNQAARKTAVGKMNTIINEKVPVAVYGAAEEGIFFSSKVKDIVLTQQTQYILADAKIDG